jgi:signal transduction histidine kinase
MSLKQFLGDKILYIMTMTAAAAVVLLMLVALNPAGGPSFAVIVGLIWLAGFTCPLAVEFMMKKRFYDALIRDFEQLDRKNLLAELLPEADFFEGSVLTEILKASDKACLEEINRYKAMQAEYQEYIELWVHEIKTPIASSKLIAGNNPNDATSSMRDELDMIETYVEQALYYARSSAVEKDYIIRELSLERPVYAVIKRNSGVMIKSGISVTAENLNITVRSDAKWLEFILHQLVINAVKYAADREPRIVIRAEKRENSAVLTVIDNGLGIPESELPRIFEKGFTGTNGRKRGKSTGMGLFICRKLCLKLGIDIEAESELGRGTAVRLSFPVGSMTDIV